MVVEPAFLMKKIIVSASDDSYFPLLIDLISSIEDSKSNSDIEIGILDVGLTHEQRDILSARVQHLVIPKWDYHFEHLSSQPQKFRAMTARPHLPQYFPGYDVIMWIDADAWIQKWSSVGYFFDKAAAKGLAICQEMHRSYANVYNLNNSRALFFNSLKAFGDEVLRRVSLLPMINSGVFAMRVDCPYWSQWSNILGAVIQRGHFNHFTEQTALNVCVYGRLPLPYFMPARFNWICVHALPMFNERTRLYVEPAVPHDEISIVHLTGMHTRQHVSPIIDLQGNVTKMNLLYSQWKPYRG
jgi:lipopolysaccharide biosynthesis glycosyltransferase